MAAEEAPTQSHQSLQAELESSRESAAHLLETLARKLRATRAGSSLERAAQYVQDHSVKDMATGVEQWVRSSPVPSIIAAVVAGFLVGRALRAPRSRR